ncbi:MAG: hypothetical protein ACW99F_18700 [Candidatus Hodarchaeales archaeon]|jgi:hypothetical protein
MQKKILLVATFVSEDYLTRFLYKIYKNFGVNKKTVFLFETEDGLLLTYKIYLNIGERVNIRKELPKTVQIHKRGMTFFTINALNRLIERDFNLDGGNVDYKKYDIDWEKYENKIILLKDDELEILDLRRKFID